MWVWLGWVGKGTWSQQGSFCNTLSYHYDQYPLLSLRSNFDTPSLHPVENCCFRALREEERCRAESLLPQEKALRSLVLEMGSLSPGGEDTVSWEDSGKKKTRNIWRILNRLLWLEQKFVTGHWESKVSRVKGHSVKTKAGICNLFFFFFPLVSELVYLFFPFHIDFIFRAVLSS